MVANATTRERIADLEDFELHRAVVELIDWPADPHPPGVTPSTLRPTASPPGGACLSEWMGVFTLRNERRRVGPAQAVGPLLQFGVIGSAPFPSMKARKLLAILEALGYVTVRQNGSHRRLQAEGRPALTFAFHDGQTIPPGLVRKVLVKDAGVPEDEAIQLV